MERCAGPTAVSTGVDTRRAKSAEPLDGKILPNVYVGRLVPWLGTFINGMQVYDGTPHDTSPFRVAPRLSDSPGT